MRNRLVRWRPLGVVQEPLLTVAKGGLTEDEEAHKRRRLKTSYEFRKTDNHASHKDYVSCFLLLLGMRCILWSSESAISNNIGS